LETAELIKKVRKIEIKTKGVTRQLFHGNYSSAFKARGIAFSEVREYNIGDEIRTIDWNVTARSGTPHVKVFDEERELNVFLMVDYSGSVEFGTKERLKKELITELSAVLGFSAIQNNDKIGIIFFTDKIEKYIPPKKGKFHTLRIIRELIELKPENTKTDLAQAFIYANRIIKKRSIIFILSDFNSNNFEKELKSLSNKHDVITLRIKDERESTFPNIGIIRFVDKETNKEILIDTSSKQTRNLLKEYWNQKEISLKKQFRKSKIDEIVIKTNEAYLKPLINFFKARGSKL